MTDFFRDISNTILREFENIEIYDLKITKFRNDFVIRIYLDDLKNPYGSVDLNTCEKFSKLFIKELDAILSETNHRNDLKNKYKDFPEDLNIDNYSLEVSSAGAERQIKFPQELERFKHLPLKVIYSFKDDNNKYKEKQIIVKYLEMIDDNVCFEYYLPKGNIRNKKKAKKEKIKLKKSEIKKVYLSLF